MIRTYSSKKKIKKLEEQLEYRSQAINRAFERINALEDVLRRSGIVEELDTTDVINLAEWNGFNNTYTKPYVINKPKV
jgi:hypothetical protein